MARDIDTGVALRNPDLISLHEAKGFAQVIVHLANGKRVESGSPADALQELELDDREQRLMRRWLEALPNPRGNVLRQINRAFKQVTPKNCYFESAIEFDQIRLSIDLLLDMPTNESQLGWLFANVLHFGLGENIRRCPECSIWFTDFPSKRPIKQYCCTEHSNAYRQRKYRKSKTS